MERGPYCVISHPATNGSQLSQSALKSTSFAYLTSTTVSSSVIHFLSKKQTLLYYNLNPLKIIIWFQLQRFPPRPARLQSSPVIPCFEPGAEPCCRAALSRVTAGSRQGCFHHACTNTTVLELCPLKKHPATHCTRDCTPTGPCRCELHSRLPPSHQPPAGRTSAYWVQRILLLI